MWTQAHGRPVACRRPRLTAAWPEGLSPPTHLLDVARRLLLPPLGLLPLVHLGLQLQRRLQDSCLDLHSLASRTTGHVLVARARHRSTGKLQESRVVRAGWGLSHPRLHPTTHSRRVRAGSMLVRFVAAAQAARVAEDGARPMGHTQGRLRSQRACPPHHRSPPLVPFPGTPGRAAPALRAHTGPSRCLTLCCASHVAYSLVFTQLLPLPHPKPALLRPCGCTVLLGVTPSLPFPLPHPCCS